MQDNSRCRRNPVLILGSPRRSPVGSRGAFAARRTFLLLDDPVQRLRLRTGSYSIILGFVPVVSMPQKALTAVRKWDPILPSEEWIEST
jgi:hypothetical protein